MEEITGKIIKYNQVKGMMPGIQMENLKWYNATEVTEKYVIALKEKVGSKVRLKHDEGKISFVEIIESAMETKTGMVNANYKTYTEKKDRIIVRECAVKASAEIIKTKPEIMKEGSEAFFDLAEMIEKWIIREE